MAQQLEENKMTIAQEKKLNEEQKATIDELLRKNAELEKMLEKSSGHKVMMENINR